MKSHIQADRASASLVSARSQILLEPIVSEYQLQYKSTEPLNCVQEDDLSMKKSLYDSSTMTPPFPSAIVGKIISDGSSVPKLRESAFCPQRMPMSASQEFIWTTEYGSNQFQRMP
jgi:hypothetical protein